MFNDAALKALFRFSGGIPRLLNLLCDRAMLGAYSQQRALVDARLVELAAGETLAVNMPSGTAPRPLWWWPLWFMLAVAAGAVLAYGWFSHGVNG